VLSGRGLCDELITRPEESYRLWCVAVCYLETSRMGSPHIYDISSLRVKELSLSYLKFPQFLQKQFDMLQKNGKIWSVLCTSSVTLFFLSSLFSSCDSYCHSLCVGNM